MRPLGEERVVLFFAAVDHIGDDGEVETRTEAQLADPLVVGAPIADRFASAPCRKSTVVNGEALTDCEGKRKLASIAVGEKRMASADSPHSGSLGRYRKAVVVNHQQLLLVLRRIHKPRVAERLFSLVARAALATVLLPPVVTRVGQLERHAEACTDARDVGLRLADEGR